jgi:DNA-directed DNA polymerase III PolC
VSLSELYEANGIDEEDRILSPKRVLFICPSKTFDVQDYVEAIGLHKSEVAVTYLKKDIAFLTKEVEAFGATLVLQLESQISRKYPFVKNAKSCGQQLFEKAFPKSVDVFVNLHHHDEYSIRDGLGTVEKLVDILKTRKDSFCSVTNHGSIGGWIKQYTICKKNNVRPIFGMEAYVNDFRGEDKEERKEHRANYHLLMFAKNETGFYNIIRIHNDAQLNGFYHRPRVNYEAIKKWGKGIIATSACMSGEIPKMLLAGRKDDAIRQYEMYRDAFDSFYIELTLIEMEEQVEVNRMLIEFAKEVGAPLVITLDCLESTTNVVMSDGSVKSIESIRVGDCVATDDGLESVVEAVGKRKIKQGERVFSVKSGTKAHSIICTEDHPFLIEFSSGRREWVKAVELRKGDYLVVPHPKRDIKSIKIKTEDYFEKKQSTRMVEGGWISTRTDKKYIVPEYIDVDEEFCWILGFYIAEGYRDNYVTGFGMHRDEGEYATKLFNFFSKYGFNPTVQNHPISKSKSVRISSFGFAPLFEKLCGKGCVNKKLPDFWRNLSDECLLALLDGYFCGDGCYRKDVLSCVSVSKNLVYQIQQAMLSLGYYANIIKQKPKLDRRTNTYSRPAYALGYGSEQICKMKEQFSKIKSIVRKKICNRGVIPKNGYHLVRISSIVELTDNLEQYDFWDISVKDRHCFVAEGRVVHNSHYLLPEHVDTHDILLLIKDHKTVLDKITNPEEVWQFDARNLYYRSGRDVEKLWEHGFDTKDGKHFTYKDSVFTREVFNEAVANTRKIALECEDIELDSDLKLPKLYKDAEGALRKKSQEGFVTRRLKGRTYSERLDRELRVISNLGFADYFLIVDRIIRDAKEKFGEFATGWGRGSAAGSLVSYCLGITDIDPIKYKLLFERFLDEDRSDPPDIDTDFDPRIRDWVKEHIVEVFGEANTCSIGTYVTYKTRAVVIDVARALGLDVWNAMSVTKNIDALAKFGDEGEEEQIDQMDFSDVCIYYPELGAYFESHPKVLQHAEILRNQVKNMGKHAGGIIISNLNLQDRIPVFRGSGDAIISAWSEGQATHELSDVGLVKFDILGLKNLSIISDCLKYIKQTKGLVLTKAEIPLDEGIAIREGSRDLVGIFQFENPATEEMVRKIKMKTIFDISAITSLLRPGPKDMGMPEEYAERKGGADYEMPQFLKEHLEETYGIIVYQEDVMHVAQVLGGFSPVESNKLRTAISKKKLETLATLKGKFLKGAEKWIQKGEITKDEVLKTWDILQSFGGYGFNRSHAMSYSAVTSAEFWLKFNHDIEYMTAVLNNTKSQKKKRQSDENTLMVQYVGYLRGKGTKLAGPDINKSGADFRIENCDTIRFALDHIKQIGSSAEQIADGQPYKDLEDFYNRIDRRRVNKRVVMNLIYAGAFDCFGTRQELIQQYFGLRSDDVPDLPGAKELIEKEREVLGGLVFSVPSILEQYAKKVRDENWKFIRDTKGGSIDKAHVLGRIKSIQSRTSKAGKEYLYVTFTDDVNTKQFYVFAMREFRKQLSDGYVASIPLKKFEDGNNWFFDEKRDIFVLEGGDE